MRIEVTPSLDEAITILGSAAKEALNAMSSLEDDEDMGPVMDLIEAATATIKAYGNYLEDEATS